MFNHLKIVLSTAVFAAGMASAATAQDFPSKPIMVISPYAPGATGEVLAREVGEELSLTAQSVDLIGHFPLRPLNQLIIAYNVSATGEVSLSEELAETKALSAGELENFDFGPLTLTGDIVRAWLGKRVVPVPNSELERARDG